MRWLENSPRVATGVTFGRPWQRGVLAPDDVARVGIEDERVPHEATVLASWPDGSVKWTRHAAVVQPGSGAAGLEPVVAAAPPGGATGLLASEHDDGIRVDTGSMRLTIPRSGDVLATQIESAAGRPLGDELRVVARTQEEAGATAVAVRTEVSAAEVETAGAVRTVVKVTGSLLAGDGPRMDFVSRLCFFAGSASIGITHTTLFHSEAREHPIAALGLELDAPITGEMYDRHVAIAGDDGVYREPVQTLFSKPHAARNPYYVEQIEQGTATPHSPESDDVFRLGGLNPRWSSFRLVQVADNSYFLDKATASDLARVRIGRGCRSGGTLYAGGSAGGTAISLRGIWQKYPAGLEASGLDTDAATLTAWLWSPAAEPMDLRHYADTSYVESAYEGFDEMRSTPEGIANTSHITVDFIDDVPSRQWLWELSSERQRPTQPICTPEEYHRSGIQPQLWGPARPDNDAQSQTPPLEARLTELVAFYDDQVEQHGWYGYWNYGDVMHSYDPVRHVWAYDIGGMAWANNEFAPNLWLWQQFMRTGDPRTFRMAEAMTWHTAEVDRHHFGEYRQLGSRHNVVHWGDAAKEVRISMAGLHRTYYYLTGDERIGELLAEVADAEGALDRLDPMRAYYDRSERLTHLRTGPDWAALASNWFTAAERGDEAARGKLEKGIRQLAGMPNGLLSGPTLEFDANAVDLVHMFTGSSTCGGYQMVFAFGGTQAWIEIAEVLQDDSFSDMVAELGRVYAMTDEQRGEYADGLLDTTLFGRPESASGLIAYASARDRSTELAGAAWEALVAEAPIDLSRPLTDSVRDAVSWRKVSELPGISTNWTAQWALNAMTCLEILGSPSGPAASPPAV